MSPSISENPCPGCWACARPAGPCGRCWAPGFIGSHDDPRPCPTCKPKTLGDLEQRRWTR